MRAIEDIRDGLGGTIDGLEYIEMELRTPSNVFKYDDDSATHRPQYDFSYLPFSKPGNDTIDLEVVSQIHSSWLITQFQIGHTIDFFD